jgi:hypothetical protein
VEIRSSARKHGVADADMRHAVDYYGYAGEESSDDGLVKVLYLGPDRAGNMLEVVVIERQDGHEIIIHAMKMRQKYDRLLGQGW